MKFTPEVQAALAVLRANAENDFEHHRLDVLERDLTSSPQVKTIDDTHQEFNGIIYRQDTHKYYSNRVFIYRAVYSYYCGDIPDGYEIHHKDFNPENNDISNLQMLTKEEHRQLHNTNYPEKEYVCEYCGKIFYSKAPQSIVRFCSKKCASNYSYKFGVAYKKVCPKCGKEFSSLVKRAKYCSPECANSSRKTIIPRICPTCGNTFQPKSSRNVYCSYSCAAKVSAKKRCKHFVEYNGEFITLVEAAEKSGIHKDTLTSRLKAGDTGARLFRPVQSKSTSETPKTD